MGTSHPIYYQQQLINRSGKILKTDTIFYQLFQHFPKFFFELIGEANTDINNYQFTSPEVKQRSFRFDGLFLPVTDSPELPIYFVEVQFQKKAKVLLSAICRNLSLLLSIRPQ